MRRHMLLHGDPTKFVLLFFNLLIVFDAYLVLGNTRVNGKVVSTPPSRNQIWKPILIHSVYYLSSFLPLTDSSYCC